MKVLALNLPQFHEVAENNEWWGKGFTEWTNVAKAVPLFRGHYQPRIPRDLGFYDLRLPIVREEQAALAEKYGIEGFCYWHYWFGNGIMELEKPLEEILKEGKPDFPFCVGWANHSWSTSTWNAVRKERNAITFLEQKYPGIEDIVDHFNYLLPAFKDKRYLKVDGKPIFVVFDPDSIPNSSEMISIWNDLAIQNGLEGIFFVGRMETADLHEKRKEIASGENATRKKEKLLSQHFNAVYSVPVQALKTLDSNAISVFARRVFQHFGVNMFVEKHDYRRILKYMFSDLDYDENVFPQVMPHWDNTPRRGRNGYVYTNEAPSLFYEQIISAIEHVKDKTADHRIVFINSWNEWGEGNYLEPDLKYGTAYLEQVAKAVLKDEG